MADERERQRRLKRQHEATGQLDDDSLYSISTQIHAGEWRGLATRLGFSAAEVSHFPIDHSFTAEQIYQMLVTWRNRQPVHVNQTKALCKALKEVGNAQLADNLTDNQPSTSKQATTQRALSCSQTPGELDYSSLYDIAEQIDANEWTRLAAKLGFNQARVSHFKDNHSSVVDQINGMLVAWRKKQPGDVNQREALCKALREVGDINLADKLSEYSASDVQSLNAANTCEDELKSHYDETGSFVQMNPWCDDLKKPIADMFTKLQLITGEGKTECTFVSYEDMLLLKTREGKLIPIAVLSGLAGRGKTTLFHKIAYDWAVGFCEVLRKYKLLLLLKMCDLKQESDLIEAVFDQLLAEDTSIDRNALGSYIKMNSGKVLILLDGFDELPTTSLNKSSFGSILKILNRRMCRGCTVLVSTRPSHLVRLTTKELIQPPFTHVRVMGFSKEDITEYVNKFYCDEPTEAKGLLKLIRSSNLLSTLAVSPMLLLLMCLLWREDSKLPETMSCLYLKALEYIGRRKDVSKEEISSVVISLGKVGLRGLLLPDQELSFKESDFEHSVLDLALKVGILTRQRDLKKLVPHSSVQFSHKTFQEYCAAFYLQSLFEADTVSFQTNLSEIFSKGPRSLEYLLRFSCGENEACTFEILKVFQRKCQKDLSFNKAEGQLALHCYFEGQCKCLPPEEFLESLKTESIFLHNLDSDSFNSVTYFLKCVSEQTQFLAEVKRLHVASCDLNRCVEDLASVVSSMSNLQLASFSGRFTGEDMAHFTESLSDLSNLFVLDVSFNSLFGTAALWCIHVKKMRKLRRLVLSNCDIGMEDLKHVAESVRDLPDLISLDLMGNFLFCAIDSLCECLKDLNQLEQLNLCGCSLSGLDVTAVADSFTHLPELCDLNLTANSLGDMVCYWSRELESLEKLEYLSLANGGLDGEDIKDIADSLRKLPNLRTLDISHNNLRGTAATWCMELKHFKAIKQLDLRECELTEGDRKHINESLADLKDNGLEIILD